MGEIARDFFVYGTNFLAIAAAASQTNSLSIQADSDFVVQKLAFTADIAAAAVTDSTRITPLCTLLITDTGSGRQMMNQAISILDLFGFGGSPFILPQPKVFRANTLISITMVNFSAATTYNVRLSFIGVKSFQG